VAGGAGEDRSIGGVRVVEQGDVAGRRVSVSQYSASIRRMFLAVKIAAAASGPRCRRIWCLLRHDRVGSGVGGGLWWLQ
jgi:hypothetical protein